MVSLKPRILLTFVMTTLMSKVLAFGLGCVCGYLGLLVAILKGSKFNAAVHREPGD